jgi:hypothetical protein
VGVYSWTGLGQQEDAVASARLSAQIALNLPGLETLGMSARRDAALAEAVAELGGATSVSSLTVNPGPLTVGQALQPEVGLTVNWTPTSLGGGFYGSLWNVTANASSSFTVGAHMQMFASFGVTNLWGYRVGQPQLSGAVAVNNFRAITIDGAVSGQIGSGTIGTVYGLYINPINVGGTGNIGINIDNVTGTGAFAIKTGLGQVSFGGDLKFSATNAQIISGPTALIFRDSGNTADNFVINSGGAIFVSRGKFTTVASASGGAGLNLPHGAAPSSPTDGDMWTTTTGLFVRINGVTVGPLT